MFCISMAGKKNMTNAEQLIENAIYAIKNGRDPDQELDSPDNKRMLAYSGLRKYDIISMARHVVDLYGGSFPG